MNVRIHTYLRAVTKHTARTTPVPETEAALSTITDRGHLSAYARVCGFAATEQLPPTYPHVLAFPLAMGLMTDRAFPLPVLGLVHIANRITVHRPIEVGERLDIRVHAEAVRPHPSGLAFDIVACVSAGDLAWESVSTYLHRGQGYGEKAPRQETSLDETAVWRLPPDTGRRYAAVSGDRNPIHLYPLTARPFGFKRAIAHGMWTKARVLAELAPRLPQAYTVEVSFGSAVLLPATVRLLTSSEFGFRLESEDGTRRYLYGAVSAL
jgi:acyl dehydratase